MTLNDMMLDDGTVWELLDGERSDMFRIQLSREVGPKHKLYEQLENCTVTAKVSGTDDVLVVDGSERNAYIVHLVWNQASPDPNPSFPSCMPVNWDKAQAVLRSLEA